MLAKNNFLPPPPGVDFVEAYFDDFTGQWSYCRLPLVCVNVIGDGLDGFDAMSLDGEWLHSIDKSLIMADGRIVAPGIAVYANADEWLAEVKLLADKRDRTGKPGLRGVEESAA